ncbi:MAG: NADH-quinone oxidoreductase subunit N [Deltaproteobacteria bacterium]|nr:NADH-quinone oxidoreductase subunit N [Deltaproteobacteria bacterium]MBW2413924.1 NADH-quinone oxidoreductase subunit N [Deltaproteobacteria bacterium]
MMPNLDLSAISPMIFVAVGAILLPLLEVLLARMIERRRSWLGRTVNREMASTAIVIFTVLLLVLALLRTVGTFDLPVAHFNLDHPMIAVDQLTRFLNAVLLISAILTVLVSSRYLADIGMDHGEFYALLLASLLGMMLLGAATDLIMLFLALELMSIPIYALAGFQRSSLKSNESALKYFIIGSFASALLLYGCALLYGATGTVELAEIARGFDPENPLTLLGAALVLVGFAFKIASVPFHQWAPDVYEGAPTTVTGFMATAVKVAAFGALIRVVAVGLQPGAEIMYGVFWWLAVLSMTVGNVMAIIQQNTKRMLAYSSVAHGGYMLVGICVGTQSGYAGLLFYLLVYTFMTIGAFTVLAILTRDGREVSRIDDLAGLHETHPFAAIVMTLCMFSLAGIPPLAGFWGKWYLLTGAVERATAIGDTSLIVLAVVLVMNSAISLAYYLRLPVVMYMREARGADRPDATAGALQTTVLWVCALAIVLIGVVPGDFLILFGDYDLIASARVAASAVSP